MHKFVDFLKMKMMFYTAKEMFFLTQDLDIDNRKSYATIQERDTPTIVPMQKDNV